MYRRLWLDWIKMIGKRRLICSLVDNATMSYLILTLKRLKEEG